MTFVRIMTRSEVRMRSEQVVVVVVVVRKKFVRCVEEQAQAIFGAIFHE